MKKTYITTITLLILIVAAVLTYISNTPGEVVLETYPVAATTTTTIATGTNDVVVKDFEGEANPDMMKLDMKTWTWISTTYNDGTIIKPKMSDKFKLIFKGKTFSASTDCNGVGGEFTTNGQSIVFEKMMSTMMYCEGSQEADFSKGLTQVSSYHFTNKGELVFDLKYDSGSMIFK